MKILFVSGGNKFQGNDPVVNIQGHSLELNGVEIKYFIIQGRGIKGYLKSALNLRKLVRSESFDLIHAHFSYSGYVASLAGRLPVVVSLLGSDVYHGGFRKRLLKFFVKRIWSETIVKSKRMKERLGIDKIHIIPNGVDLGALKEEEKATSLSNVNLDPAKKHVIFVTVDPSNPIKNFELAKAAFNLIENKNAELNVVSKATRSEMPYYMSAADVLLLTSVSEGSPNVVKEAMACNLPIVSTDVGDVAERIDGVSGCYLADPNAADVARKLDLALSYNKRTNGREKIKELEINKIAGRIIEIYKTALRN